MKKLLLSYLLVISSLAHAQNNPQVQTFPIREAKVEESSNQELYYKFIIEKDGETIFNLSGIIKPKENFSFNSFKNTPYVQTCTQNLPKMTDETKEDVKEESKTECINALASEGITMSAVLSPIEENIFKLIYNGQYSEIVKMQKINVGQSQIDLPEFRAISFSDSIEVKKLEEVTLKEIKYSSDSFIGTTDKKSTEYRFSFILQ